MTKKEMHSKFGHTERKASWNVNWSGAEEWRVKFYEKYEAILRKWIDKLFEMECFPSNWPTLEKRSASLMGESPE